MSLIEDLKKEKNLYGDCPCCSQEFPLSKALLFHVKGPFPEAAVLKLEELKAQLIERQAELKRQKARMTTRTEKTTLSVNIGKIVEKIVPSFGGFSFEPRDCRALFEPIDYLVFHGLTRKGKVSSLSFVDVKSGKAGLKKSQKAIRDVVSAGRLKLRLCLPRREAR